MTKQELRAQLKKTIAQMKSAERDTSSLYVCLQIIGTEEWQNAQTVMLYKALADEIDLSLLIQDAEGATSASSCLRPRPMLLPYPKTNCKKSNWPSSQDAPSRSGATVWDAARAITTDCSRN